MQQTLFSGVCTALITPFLNGCVNYPLMEQLLKRQIEAGISAVVIAGTTGEAPALTDAEKIELIARCKNIAKERCLIIAGTGSNNTEHSLQLSIAAQNAGADAVMLVSPYYNKANADGLFLHFATIANAVSVPVILYNVPSRTGVDIPVHVYQRLSHIPNIAGVKEASTAITKITEIRSACPDHFAIWSGNDDMVVPSMALGSKGVISVASNILPKETAAMAHAALSGDYATAAKYQLQLKPLIDLLFCDINPIPVKSAMRYIGFDCGECRLPLGKLSRENQTKLLRYLESVHLVA